MRIHTNTLTLSDFQRALIDEQTTGRIGPDVHFDTLTPHASKSHARAFEVRLGASTPAPGRRSQTAYGNAYPSGYSATYDEWGWLMAALYRVDPEALWGNFKRPIYSNLEHFDQLTGLSYNPLELLRTLPAHQTHATDADHSICEPYDPYPWVRSGGRVKAKVGRQGYGRLPFDAPNYVIRYCKYVPRTPEQVREFAHLDTNVVVS